MFVLMFLLLNVGPFRQPFAGKFGDFWCRKGGSERNAIFFENVVFIFVFVVKLEIGGSEIEPFWPPWVTLLTFGNEVYFRIDFGWQK